MDRKLESGSRTEVIDLITVVFAEEIPLIEIQARSIGLYIDSNRIGNIYVVVNDKDSVVDLLDKKWWGANEDKVQIIPASHFGVADTLDGWSSQQLYKLLAARDCLSSWSMCLDAKTWFVNQLEWDHIFLSNKANFTQFPTAPVFDNAKKFLEHYYQKPLLNIIGPGGVPFLFHSPTVKNMIIDIEKRENNLFFNWFVENLLWPNQVTEFMLYSAYVNNMRSYFDLYTGKQYYSITNMAEWEVDKFEELFKRMQSEKNLTASIHRKAYKMLSQEQLDQWTSFLFSKKLVPSPKISNLTLNTLL